jgi:hypothetical protein
VINLLRPLIREDELIVDFDDPVVDATCVTASGKVRNEEARGLLIREAMDRQNEEL